MNPPPIRMTLCHRMALCNQGRAAIQELVESPVTRLVDDALGPARTMTSTIWRTVHSQVYGGSP
jgi:hypothetical protein